MQGQEKTTNGLGLLKAIVTIVVALTLTVVSCRQRPESPESTETPTSPALVITETTQPPVPPVSPATPAELTVISNLNPGAGPENITDVWALTAYDGKTYAYLGTYDRPSCSPDTSGVHIVDISRPANPAKVGLVPSPAGTRVSDVQAAHVQTGSYSGDLLVFTVEVCATLSSEARQNAPKPGIVIVDITNPLAPFRLAPDFSLGFETHNNFIYQQGDRAFTLVVQDGSSRDFHIVELTNPYKPGVVFSGGAIDWLKPDAQKALGALPASFVHDVWARSYPASHPNPRYAGKTIAYLSYWDAGLIILDITDPAKPVFLGDSDYLIPDPLTGQPPEGNSHSAVPTEDGNLVFMGDEDFSPSHSLFTIDTGRFAGNYSAIEAGFTRQISTLPDQRLTGDVVYIGRACTPADIPPPPRSVPGAVYIALIERGDCPFEDKIVNAATAGYQGAVVFGTADSPNEVIGMSGSPEKGAIPALFVPRSVAFSMLGIAPGSPAATPLPPVGITGEHVTVRVLFDGWGYGRILDVTNPADIIELGQFATRNALSRSPAPGDHSIHNMVVKGRRAYISWYADGVYVVDFSDPKRPREVASWVDKEKGSDFWGVYLVDHPDGNSYILGSDRTTGLWIFQAP